MNRLDTRNTSFGKQLLAFMALVLLAHPALRADDKSKPKPPAQKPAAAPSHGSAPANRPAGGGPAASHSPSTASHGPTTASPHGPTTASPHGPTTASPHGATTTTGSHAAATTASHPTNTSPHTTTTPTRSGATGTGAKTTPARQTTPEKAAPAQPRLAKNQTVSQRPNGSSAVMRGNKVATLHDTKRGMEVHHTLTGNRRVVVERADHTRIVAERGGRGYVQRPYMYHGHEFATRSYYYGGRSYNVYYGRYYYGGVYMYPYYPTYYYSPYYYGWAANPWVTPVPYAWGWNVNPWYGYYGAYFTPYPVYAGPAFWITDYLISTSLAAAYQAQVEAAALSNPAPLSPEVKQLIADEVKQQITLEYNESQAVNKTGEPNAAVSSVQQLLTDGKQHVFVAAHDLDVVDASGGECALSEGDAIQLQSGPAGDGQPATLAVLASKGGRECPKGDVVSVALPDLQDMQNHMRETIDQGMQELQQKQGTKGLPAAPASAKEPPKQSAMALAAPPPPPESEVAAQIKEQSQEADRAETEAGLAPAPEPATQVSIAAGQTVAQVEAAMGKPLKTVTLGPKKIYVYKDIKITFKDDKVSDVQ